MTMDYGFDELFGSSTANLTALASVILLAMLLAYAVAIVNYVFVSLSLYTVGKRRGLRLYGMGWVPIGQQWLLGCIADQYDRKAKGKDMKLGRFFLIGSIAMIAVMIISLVLIICAAVGLSLVGVLDGGVDTGSLTTLIIGLILLVLVYIFVIVWAVFYYIALYKFFKSCTPKNAVWMLILSIFTGLGCAICMLCVRKKDDGFVELQQETGYIEHTEE